MNLYALIAIVALCIFSFLTACDSTSNGYGNPSSATVQADCHQLRCEMVQTIYSDSTESNRTISTYWEVCPSAEIAINLATKQKYSVDIFETHIEFKTPPTIPNSTGLNPVGHGFYNCKRISG